MHRSPSSSKKVMARVCMRLVLVAIFYMGLAYGSSRSNVFTSHYVDMAHKPLAPLAQGICESVVIPRGYPCKEYQVKTEDGYIIGLQNIPGGRSGNESDPEGGKKQPILLQHGVLVDGMTWFLGNSDESLGYILADSGFDVWIANTRGTRSSLKHAYLDPSKPAYWNWSWDELVQYELPAIVGFVYGRTGKKIHYVGHSMGTLTALASFSEGKLLDMVRSAALLCPIAYLSHMTTPIGNLATRGFMGEILTGVLHVPEFNPKGLMATEFLENLCSRPGINCYDFMALLTGKNCCLNSSTDALYLMYEPQPTSTRNLVHLAQTVRDGVIRKFDYRHPVANLIHYGWFRPPVYDMSKIPNDLPLFLSHGGQDALADPRDVELLLDRLRFHDVDKLKVQFVENYAHADFIMGTNAKSTVYNEMIAFFNSH